MEETEWVSRQRKPDAQRLERTEIMYLFVIIVIILGATVGSMWDPSSLTRDRTCAARIRTAESSALGNQGSPTVIMQTPFWSQIQLPVIRPPTSSPQHPLVCSLHGTYQNPRVAETD